MSLRARLAREDGFTIIEVTFAVVVLTVGVLAVFASFDTVRRLTAVSQAQNARAQVAEQELQRIVSLGYSNIGLSSAPAHSTNPLDPDYYVSGTPAGFQWDLANPARTETLCTPATSCTGSLATGPVSWSSGDKSGSMYRFVTWVDDACDPTALPSACPTAFDYKRVTVMLTENGRDVPAKPLLLSTLVADPNAGPGAG